MIGNGVAWKTGLKVSGKTDETIVWKTGWSIDGWTVARIDRLIAVRITGQTQVAKFVDSIGQTMLLASMVAKGKTALDSCKMMDRTEESG